MRQNDGVRETHAWRSAMHRGLGIFGLSDKPGGASFAVAAILIVIGAALLAALPAQGIATNAGGLLWLAGAVIALRGWVRLMRLRGRNSH
jgi:hypothetical protein